MLYDERYITGGITINATNHFPVSFSTSDNKYFFEKTFSFCLMNKAVIVALLFCVTSFTGCIGGDNSTDLEVLKEEEAVMSRIADLIRQKAILVARKNYILSCIKRKKGTVEEMMNSHMKQIKNFKQVKGL